MKHPMPDEPSGRALRQQRALWLEAARDARYRPHAELAPSFVSHARAVHRQLMQLCRGAVPSSFAPFEVPTHG
jgi:hypothetical protein